MKAIQIFKLRKQAGTCMGVCPFYENEECLIDEQFTFDDNIPIPPIDAPCSSWDYEEEIKW